MTFVLRVRCPDGRESEMAVPEHETPVGRDPQGGLVLDGRGVSWHHARLLSREGALSIVDLNSTYGTRVNGVPATTCQLVDGDQVCIGEFQLEVYADSADGGEFGHRAQATTQPVDLEMLQAVGVQIVPDDADHLSRDVHVLADRAKSLTEAVKRHAPAEGAPIRKVASQADQFKVADYRALLLMYKVSERLAMAANFDEFIVPVADLVMAQVQAHTVVVLLEDREGQLKPRAIRQNDELGAHEVSVSRTVLDRVVQNRSTVFSSDVTTDERFQAGQSMALHDVRAVVAAPVLVCGEVKGALYVTRRGPLSFCEADADMVSAVATLLASGIEKFELRAGLVQERHRRKQLERFHPSEVVSEIFAKNKGLGQLEEYSATALVCDLHHFDKLAGQVPPRDVARVMYEYYDMLYAKVFGAGGSLIKLHNGWALALFGMHTTGEDRTEWAVEAALRLCDEFASVSVLWPKSELMVLRCALDVGTVVAGVVGSPDRLEFAALGPAVSTASEIAESGTRTSVLLSERVFRRLPQKEYAAEDVGSVRDQRVYRVIDP